MVSDLVPMQLTETGPNSSPTSHLAGAQPSQEVRYYQLDSLRGFAAMTVLFLHFQNIYLPQGKAAQLSHRQFLLLRLVNPLISGNSAVDVFFVLSGFVLMLPFLRGKQGSYGLFVLRRILRIYGPYLVALLLAMAGAAIWSGPRDLGDWRQGPWADAPTWRTALDHVLLVGIYSIRFNPVFWTLVVEMRVSLLFPLLARTVNWLRSWVALAGALSLSATARLVIRHGGPGQILTLEYLGIFILGMVLAKHIRAIGARISALPSFVRLLLGVAASSLYILGGHLLHAGNWAAAFASVGFIVLAMYSPTLGRFLNLALPRVLGRISYSLYLVHVPLLMVLTIYFRDRLSAWILLPLFLALAFGFAVLFYLAVERPFTQLSRRVAHVRVTEA